MTGRRRRLARWAFVVAAGVALAVLLSSASATRLHADAESDSELTTVLLIRHAERDTKWVGTDDPLSMIGKLRARELVRVLEEADVSAIYATKWRRNRETAEPLARAIGDSLRVLDGRDFDAQAKRIRSHRGGTVVVIGHSDTVPQLYQALTGAEWRGYRSGEWDPILVLTLGPNGAFKTVTLKYGDHARGAARPE